ncbi:MAG: triose-phosphate isomerase [Candidatus Peribacteraceae bacterium]|jgi:triosephosphate isomerase
MRTPLIAANWKMNPPPLGWDAADSPYRPRPDVDVIVFPTFLDLAQCVDAEMNTGAQCGHPDPAGAHTGDVSVAMVSDLGCTYVLCGHSERRQGHGETDAFVAREAQAALDAGLEPVVCIGETQEERDAGKERDVVQRQFAALPSDVSVIAYEPVWAIGTGKNATPEQAQEMHAFIRSLIAPERRASVRILYGGSMNEKNAKELLGQPDIDGGLIGGASLKSESFLKIVEVAADVGRA